MIWFYKEICNFCGSRSSRVAYLIRILHQYISAPHAHVSDSVRTILQPLAQVKHRGCAPSQNDNVDCHVEGFKVRAKSTCIRNKSLLKTHANRRSKHENSCTLGMGTWRVKPVKDKVSGHRPGTLPWNNRTMSRWESKFDRQSGAGPTRTLSSRIKLIESADCN